MRGILDNTLSSFEDFYKEATKKYKEDEEFRKAANGRTLLLQNKDPETVRWWQFIRAVSVLGMLRNYYLLGVSMPIGVIRGESFYAGVSPVSEKDLVCAQLALLAAEAGLDLKKDPKVILEELIEVVGRKVI